MSGALDGTGVGATVGAMGMLPTLLANSVAAGRATMFFLVEFEFRLSKRVCEIEKFWCS